MKQLRNLKKWVTDYNLINQKVEELEILMEFQKSGEIQSEEVLYEHDQIVNLIEDLEFRNMLSEEGDNLSAIIQITAGAGAVLRLN